MTPWLRLKSSQRATYDAARAALPQGLDEVILLNERDGSLRRGPSQPCFFDRGAGCGRRRPWPLGLFAGRGCAAASLLAAEEVILVPRSCRTLRAVAG